MDRRKTNSKKILFFDTETTDLYPGNICQLSYIIIENEDIIDKNFFFKVDYVQPAAENIHGFSVEKLKKLSNNMTFKDQINLLRNDFDEADLLVGHNINFDLNFISSEYKKSGLNFTYNENFCTMRHFTSICKIPNHRGYGYKWPRLEELTKFLNIKHKDILKATENIFGSKNIGYHDARFDTTATYLAYMEGIDRGLINILGRQIND